MTPGTEVRLHDPCSPEATALVGALLAELHALYPEGWSNTWQPDELVGPGACFLLASSDGLPIGCGGFRLLEPGVAELRRVYVVPSARARGIAGLLLSRLEEVALAAGYTRLRLETGVRQPAALRLYERAGYQVIPAFAPYREDPLSVCLEKTLAGAQ